MDIDVSIHTGDRRARRASGGMIVYVRNSIRQAIKVVKNDMDCIMWFYLDKQFFQMEDDWYMSVIPLLKQRLKDTSITEWRRGTETSPTMLMFKNLKPTLKFHSTFLQFRMLNSDNILQK